MSAIDLDPVLATELAELVPLDPGTLGDWRDVERRAGEAHGPRRALLLAATVGATLVALLATPLGGAVARGIEDFSAWLTGTAGRPVSDGEQRAFDEASARAWSAFPPGTTLRRLLEERVDGVGYTVLGLRAGDDVCVRVEASGDRVPSSFGCVPVSALRSAAAPVVVVRADQPVAPGETHGGAPFAASVTFGIAADGVDAVELRTDEESAKVDVVDNTFVYVASRPRRGTRVRGVEAILGGGGRVDVPFASAPYGTWDLPPAPRGQAARARSRRSLGARGHGRLDPSSRASRRGAAARHGRARHSGDAGEGRVGSLDPHRSCRGIRHARGRAPGRPAQSRELPRRRPHGLFHPGLPRPAARRRLQRAGDAALRRPVHDGREHRRGRRPVRRALRHRERRGRAHDALPGQRRRRPRAAARQRLRGARAPRRLSGQAGRCRCSRARDRDQDVRVGSPSREPCTARARRRVAKLAAATDQRGVRSALWVAPAVGGGTCYELRTPNGATQSGCRPSPYTGSTLAVGVTGLDVGRPVLVGIVGDAVTRVTVRYPDGSETTLRPAEGYVLAGLDPTRTEDGEALLVRALDADGVAIGQARLELRR